MAVEENCVSHYQVQGTWTTTQGKHVNYMVLREGLDDTENHKIGNVYLNLGDVQACGGLLLNDLQMEATDRAHVRLVHLVADAASWRRRFGFRSGEHAPYFCYLERFGS